MVHLASRVFNLVLSRVMQKLLYSFCTELRLLLMLLLLSLLPLLLLLLSLLPLLLLLLRLLEELLLLLSLLELLLMLLLLTLLLLLLLTHLTVQQSVNVMPGGDTMFPVTSILFIARALF